MTLQSDFVGPGGSSVAPPEALKDCAMRFVMLARNPRLHPFYWANFIQSGDWSPLDRQ